MASSMKDSGVDWIGKIPEEWGIAKAKYYFTNDKEVAGALAGQLPRLALTLNGVVDRPKDDANGLQPKEFTGYQIFDRNDLVFKLIDLQNISTSRVGLVPKRGIMSGAYIRLIGRATISPNYSRYFYLSMWHRQIFNKLGDDGVRSSLSVSDLLNLPITAPPLDEQKRIAGFLDKTCNEIDKLSTDIQSQIDKLVEYKKSIITHAVTKGLDPSAQMKDSGVDWIGKIPKEWEICRVSHCFYRKNSKAHQKDPVVLSLARDGIKIRDISTNEGQLAADYTDYNPVDTDDILINPMDLVSGDNCSISNVRGVISPAYINLRYHKTADPHFYHYYFKTQYWLGVFFSYGKGVSFDNRWTLSYSTLNKLPIAYPPLSEQKRIANYLDNKCSNIDGIIKIKKKQLDKLAEYKKSIIYEYTTGKKRIKE